MFRKTVPFALALFAVSFAVRAALVLALRDVHAGPCGICSADDVEFNNLALRLSRGEGYVNDQGLPTSFRAPGWPLFLAGIYRLAGVHVPLVYGVLCLLGALSCVLTYLLARELVSERTARIAGFLAAIYLPHVYFSAGFLSEGLFVPLLALGAWLFVRSLKVSSLPLLLVAGLTLSYAALTRPFTLLLWPILCAILMGTRPQPRGRRLPHVLAFTLAFSFCIVPWTLRNQHVHGRFVLIATNGGSTFYGGNNERVVSELRQLGNWISTTELPHRDWIDAAPTEIEHDKMEWKLGLDWLSDHPRFIPLLCAYKTARLCLWLPDFDGGSRWYLLVRVLGYMPFLPLILLGLIPCARQRAFRKAEWLAVHGVMIATLITALIFWGSPRFRDANLPFLMLYAAVGLEEIMSAACVNNLKRHLLTPQTKDYAPTASQTASPSHQIPQKPRAD